MYSSSSSKEVLALQTNFCITEKKRKTKNVGATAAGAKMLMIIVLFVVVVTTTSHICRKKKISATTAFSSCSPFSGEMHLPQGQTAAAAGK